MKNLVVLVIIAVMLASCVGSTTKIRKENSIGQISEVLVVCSNENWKGAIGLAVKERFYEIKPWFVMEEPLFDITQIPHENYGGIYGKYRNVLMLKIDESLKEAKIEMKRNVNANIQSIIVILSPDANQLIETFKKYSNTIEDEFLKNEIDKINLNFSINNEKEVSKLVEEKYAYKMQFPKGFAIGIDTANFLWLRSKTKDVEMGVMIYTYQFADTSVFNVETIKNVRNTLTKKYIPGPIDGSYMKISDVFPMHSERVNFKGNYSTLLRSWWDVEGYKLGGAFLSYTFVDTVSQRVTMLDGYVQAPNEPKRDWLLQVEAILKTFEPVKMVATKPESIEDKNSVVK